MHLIGMWFGDVPPLTQRIKFKFDEHVNVFVGPNASGKSTVLMALARYFEVLDRESEAKRPSDDFYMDDAMADFEFDAFVDEEDPEYDIIVKNWEWLSDRRVSPAVVHLNSVREGLPGISVLYSDGETDQSAGQILSGPFNGSQTIRALDALVKEAQGNDSDRISNAIELAVACGKKISPEVINDATTRHYIPEFDSRVVPDDPISRTVQPRVLWSAAIGTRDVRNFSNYPVQEKPSWDRYGDDLDSAPIYIGRLSSGTEGTLLWILWLALKMLHHYRFTDGWEKRPAILLIDEIENHLHPTWQRRVIPALLEHFPGLQVFATTHSPFVVAGRKAGQVHLLNRDENGVVTATTNTEDIVGWTADEILRTMMGVDDPTDDETARNAAELRQLRDEGPRADEREEAERQKRMQQLRRLVDRDLLAGGPMARRREEFANRFREAMARRREEELNQDNG